MTELNINNSKNIGSLSLNIQQGEVAKSTSNQASMNSVMSSSQNKIQEFCKRFNITEAQYQELILKYPDLLSKGVEDVQKIILEEQNAKVSPKVDKSDENKTDAVNAKSSDVSVDKADDMAQSAYEFNHDEYSKYNNLNKKESILAEEIAKNKFVFSDGKEIKSLKEWNALSAEERQKLIKVEEDKLNNDLNRKLKFDRESLHVYLDKKMLDVQTANYNKKLFDEKYFNEEESFEYVNLLPSEQRSKLQQGVLDQLKVSSGILVDLLKESNDTKFKNLYEGKSDVIFTPTQMEAIKKELNVNGVDILIEKLQRKVDAKQATKVEKQVLKDLQEQSTYLKIGKDLREKGNVNYGRIDAAKKMFQGQYNENSSVDYKVMILHNYIERLPKKEQRQAFEEVVTELAQTPEGADVIVRLGSSRLLKATQAEKSKNTVVQAVVAHNVPQLDEEATTVYAQNFRNTAINNPASGQLLAGIIVDNMDVNQADKFSCITDENLKLGINNEAIPKKFLSRVATDPNVKAEVQAKVFADTAEHANDDVSKYAVRQLPKLKPENQVDMDAAFSKKPELAAYNNEVNSIAKYAKENQVEIGKNRRIRFEQSDFSKKEAVKQLNILSDQIIDVDKDNQLALHEDMMQSKYSEVQEHTASNISKYDPSVQTKALEVVYKSGNSEAVEEAISSLEKSPVYVQEEVLPVILEKLVMEGKNVDGVNSLTELREKLLSGEDISKEEYYSLSPADRKEYFTKLFKKLPLEQKLKLLSSMPNGSQRKTVYVMIARTDANLFNAIVKDKDRADMLLGMNLPNDVNNKIVGVVKFLAVSDIGYQNIAKKYEIDYSDGADTLKQQSSYNSVPVDFDKKEIYKKDRMGNLLA